MSDLTPHQLDAVRNVAVLFNAGAPIVSLTGMAGTGKTHVIPHLKRFLPYEMVVCTPTHRAAMILRGKGLEDVDTIHARCLVPVFAPAYVEAQEWCTQVGTLADEEPLPPLPELLVLTAITPALLRLRCHQYTADKVLRSCGVRALDYLVGYGPRTPQPGVLVIDEASMIGEALLALATQVYRRILLVGDPAQLPPVRDCAVLDHYAGARLTDIHRQAQESPIIALAYQARHGVAAWRRSLREYAPDVMTYSKIPAAALLESPLIVWRNSTRIAVAQAARHALGYPEDSLVEGEPLICRSTDKGQRLDGFFNNSLFKVAKVLGPREVILRQELTEEETEPTLVHLEETDGTYQAPESVLFRFGYAATCHTMQGGEWPTVYLSVPELQAYSSMAQRTGNVDDLSRWVYTAITRAKSHLGLLTTHTLTKG